MRNECEWTLCALEIDVQRDGLRSRQSVRSVTSLPVRALIEASLSAAQQSLEVSVLVSLPIFRKSTLADSNIILRILQLRPTDPVPLPFLNFF